MNKDKTNNLVGTLSDGEIRKRLDKPHDLKIHPLINRNLQVSGCKVDLHLSGVFYEIKQSAVEVYDPLDPLRVEYRRELVMPLNRPYTLHPGMYALAPTYENVSMPKDLLGVLQGRSSLGRLGVIVHATASFVDPGYKGALTLELSNLGHLPVNLYALGPVATIAFLTICGEVQALYGDLVPSPILSSQQQRLGKHDSPISEPSKYGHEWEFDIMRRIREASIKENGGGKTDKLIRVKLERK